MKKKLRVNLIGQKFPRQKLSNRMLDEVDVTSLDAALDMAKTLCETSDKPITKIVISVVDEDMALVKGKLKMK